MGSVDRERRIAAIEARLKNAPVCAEHAQEADLPIGCVVCGAPARYWTPKDQPAKPDDPPSREVRMVYDADPSDG